MADDREQIRKLLELAAASAAAGDNEQATVAEQVADRVRKGEL